MQSVHFHLDYFFLNFLLFRKNKVRRAKYFYFVSWFRILQKILYPAFLSGNSDFGKIQYIGRREI